MSSVFFNPWVLLALAGIAIPLIIEWLFRRRKRQIELPTLRFLLNNQEQEKIRRQDRILLIVRMIVVGLLILALSRPLIQRGWIKKGRDRQVVVVLDGTASMNQQVDVSTAFGRAQKKAAGVVRGLPAQTLVSVIYLGEQAEVKVPPTNDVHTAAAAIEDLRAGSGAASMDQALVRVADCLKDGVDAEMYVFSDFQKQTWPIKAAKLVDAIGNGQPIVPERAGQSPQDQKKQPPKCEIFMVDCGGQPEFNYLLTDLHPEEPTVSANMPVRFEVTAEARGNVKDGKATIQFMVDGVKKDLIEVTLGKEPVKKTFEYRFGGAGEYLVEAMLEGDEHRVDNRRSYLCSVPDSLKVLILDEQAESPTADSLFLSRAIAPPVRPGIDKVSHFTTQTVSPALLSYENIDDYAMVVLTATGTLTEQVVNRLDRYVRSGGALWIFLGPQVNQYDYNRLMCAEGDEGLLPCKLAGRVVTSQPDAQKGETPAPRYGESTNPALAMLAERGGATGAADAVSVVQYYTLENVPGSSVVLRWGDGRPAILEKKLGQGRVLLSTTTAGPEWSYLAAEYEYVVMVQELMRYLIGDRDRSVNLPVNGRFRQPIYVPDQVQFRCPDNSYPVKTPTPAEGEKHMWLEFADTNEAGLYEVIAVGGLTEPKAIQQVLPRYRFVVNQSAREGDLARWSPVEFKDSFASNAWSWVSHEEAIEEMAAKRHTVIELIGTLLWALVTLLAIESLLAWRFGRRRGEVTS